MPIYKVSVDSSRAGPPQVQAAGDARDGSAAGQGEVLLRGGDGGMSFMEKTEADRQLDGFVDWKQQRVLGTSAQLGLGPESAAGGRAGSNLFEVEPRRNSANMEGESIIDREVKEFLKREAEWVVRHEGAQAAPLGVTPAPIAAPQSTGTPYNHYTAPPVAREPLLLDLSYDSGASEQNQLARAKAEKRVSFAEQLLLEPDVTVVSGGADRRSANPGEGLILQEMEEQRRREEELKLHWRDMGFDLPDNHRADDVDATAEENPPGNFGDAAFSPTTRDQPANHWDLSGWNNPAEQQLPQLSREWKPLNEPQPKEWKPATAAVEPPHPSPTREVSRTTSQQSHYGANAVRIAAVPLASLPPADESQPRRANRVQPLVDDDDATEEPSRPQFAPHDETLIQREIRLAREREEALRLARGMPAARVAEAGEEAAEEIEVMVKARPTSFAAPSDGGVGENETMKKYAESRLQEELRKEKDRELALRRQGSIHTISEERIGEPVKFVEIISPETELQLQRERERAKERAVQRSKEQEQKQDLRREEAKEYVARYDVATYSAPPSAEQRAFVTSQRTSLDRPDGGDVIKSGRGAAPGSPVSPAVQYRVSKTPPKVLLTYSYNPMQADESHELVSRNEAGLRIEQEVAEAKRREEELRAQREALRAERGGSVSTLEVKPAPTLLPAPSPSTKPIQLPLPPAAPLQPQPALLLAETAPRVNGSDGPYYQGGGAAAYQALDASDGSAAAVFSVEGAARGEEGEQPFDDRLYLSGGDGSGPRRLALIGEWEKMITSNS